MTTANRAITAQAAGSTLADGNGSTNIDLLESVNACVIEPQMTVELKLLDEEIARAEAASKLMAEADRLLRRGEDVELLRLGFSPSHIADLRKRAGRGGGYPQYSLRNIKVTLCQLREARRNSNK